MSEISRTGARPELITAMITPFVESGQVNYDAASEVADYLAGHGSDGLVLAGTTGESPALNMRSQIDLFRSVANAVGSRISLIGGTGANTNHEAMQLTRDATELGVLDKLLVVSPYYNRPSQYGIQRYYEDVARSTDLPVILYNIPVRTGREVSFETAGRLFEKGAIAGVKDATGNTAMAERLIREYGEEIEIYSGDDSLNMDFMRAGAVGAISVASHWAGEAMAEQFDAFANGNGELVEKIGRLLAPSYEFESVHTSPDGRLVDTPNPIPSKAMMGHILGEDKIGAGVPPMLASPEDMDYLRRRASVILEQLEDGLEQLGISAS